LTRPDRVAFYGQRRHRTEKARGRSAAARDAY